MRVIVQANAGHIQMAYEGVPVEAGMGRPFVSNSAVIRRLVPQVSEARLRAAAAEYLRDDRQWLWGNVNSVVALRRVLAFLGCEATVGQICQAVAQEAGSNIVVQLRSRGMARAAIVVPEVGGDEVANVIGELNLESPSYLSIGSKLFRLQIAGEGDILPEVRRELEGRAAEHQQALQELAVSLNDEVARRVAEIEDKYQHLLQIPQLTADDVRLGLQVCHIVGGHAFYLPLLYQPKYLIARVDGRRLAIPEELALKLTRQVRVEFSYTKRGGWAIPRLVDEAMRFFPQYHERCWGSLEWRERIKEVPGSLYGLRDLIQAEMEIINGPGVHTPHPAGLISLTMLEKETLVAGQEVAVWSQAPPRAPARPMRVARSEEEAPAPAPAPAGGWRA